MHSGIKIDRPRKIVENRSAFISITTLGPIFKIIRTTWLRTNKMITEVTTALVNKKAWMPLVKNIIDNAIETNGPKLKKPIFCGISS